MITNKHFHTLNNAELSDTVVALFNLARQRAHEHRLLDLYTLPSSALLGSSYGGVQEVAIHEIRGTEGRCNDFDSDFHPLHDRDSFRWQLVAEAFLRGVSLPPVELIQIGDIYYVRNGHHRISVACAFGEQFIQAKITIRTMQTPMLE